jgi:membrane associated rhomboid family serine protease
MNELVNALQTIVDQTQHNMYLIFVLLGIMLAVLILTKLTGTMLYRFGIFPRKPYGLLGILFSPFIHADFNHFFFNAIPFFVLSDFILVAGTPLYFKVSAYITFLSGLLTWCFARPGVHIGASGVITGYWAFLMLNVYSDGGVIPIMLGVVSVYYFAGIFFGIFPTQKGVSWEGHLFGLLAGLLTNYGLHLGLLT